MLAHGLRDAAPYAVVMAYRVRFYMDMNAREAMHVIELRTAPQGHPSYRRVCQLMHRAIADVAGHRAIAAAMQFADHSEVELERLQSERALREESDLTMKSGPPRFDQSFGPVARVLVEKRQRLERLHPIEEQHAVQVIGFVLDDPRWEIVRAQLEAFAVPIERAHLDLARPRHAAADVRNAQTAFPVLDDVARRRR